MPEAEMNIKRVTIMGLGLFGGGLGVARYWAELGNEIVITDLRGREVLSPSIAALQQYGNITYVLEEHREKDFTDTDLVVVNPAVRPDNRFIKLSRDAGIPVTTEIGIFIEQHQKKNRNPLLAITGSNGKSTTTSLLASIISVIDSNALSGGNIGGSLLGRLGGYPSGTPAVLELSSFQLFYLSQESFAPDISVITNLSPNHLDWHVTLDNYYNDKMSLISAQDSSGCCILNYDDPVLREWRSRTEAEVIFTTLEDRGLDNSAFISGRDFCIRYHGREGAVAPVSALKLPGRHNLSNALQALAAAYMYVKRYAPASEDSALENGLGAFTGLEHRQENVATINNRTFVNDSIATTPESTIAALNSYGDKEIVIIAGGYDKKIPLEEMSREISEKARAAVLIGQTAGLIATQIRSCAPDFDITVLDGNESFEKAVRTAYEKTSNGIILLSPGCASYGMFTNFQERGNSFKMIAEKIGGMG